MIKVNKNWTLFLDRDGVINVERNNDYVYNPSQFIFDKGVLATLEKCDAVFQKIVVVTNQRGIGRGLMSTQNLTDVHNYMLEKIQENKGRLDAIYFAPNKSDNDPDRKPNSGMAHQAKKDFPAIDFEKSIMVGNNISDMEFGKRLNMKTIFLQTTSTETDVHPLVDYSLQNLQELFTVLDISELTSH